MALIVSCGSMGWAQSGSLRFGGTNGYVELVNDSKLNLPNFTLECWVRMEGFGALSSSGSGGVRAVPLITKGIAGEDGDETDINYFFGILRDRNVLCLDFEEGASGSFPGTNHPLLGKTVLKRHVWYHVAATYDGTESRLYLNGKLEAFKVINEPVRQNSYNAVAIGSSISTANKPVGFLHGSLDEVRIWSYARSQAEILSYANRQIKKPVKDLVGCWPLDESFTGYVANPSGSIYGFVRDLNFEWLETGAGFNIDTNQNVAPRIDISSSDLTICAFGDSVSLSLTASDSDTKDDVVVSIYGRLKDAPRPFSLVALPDAQFYTEESLGGSNRMFKSQTKWIVANKDRLNIAHTVQLGDCVQNGDNNGDDTEWKRADTTMSILEDEESTRVDQGMSYTMCVGNHDQSPIYDPDGTTDFFNQYFGVKRFFGRYYWGGNHRHNADNSYQLFSKNGLDFIVVSVEYDEEPDQMVLNWADSLLKVHKGRSAIIVGHFFINTAGHFGTQGRATYDALKNNPNLFLMLCGHQSGEAMRRDTYKGRTVYTLLTDYQRRKNGGSGWLRTMEIDASKRRMEVATYSPWLNESEYDDNSHFVLNDLNIQGTSKPFSLLHRETLKGGKVSFDWKNLKTEASYEWYATVTDGVDTITGSVNTVYTYLKESVPTLVTSDSVICKGASASFQASGGELFVLRINGQNVSELSNQQIFHVPDLKDGDMVSLKGFNGCVVKNSRSIEMTTIPEPSIEVTCSDTDYTICPGDTVYVSTTGAGTVKYFLNEGLFSVGQELTIHSLEQEDLLEVTGANECFEVSQNLDFEIRERPLALINQIGQVLYSNYTEGNQWFFNGKMLDQDTNQFLLPEKNGDYSTRVISEFGCIGDVSAPFKFSTSGIRNILGHIGFEVYPNPFSDQFQIRAAESFEDVLVELFDATGNRVARINGNSGGPGSQWLTIRSSEYNLKAGVYFIRVSSESSVYHGQIISLYR